MSWVSCNSFVGVSTFAQGCTQFTTKAVQSSGRPAKAKGRLKFLRRPTRAKKLPSDKKKLVKEFLDAFIFKSDLQKQLAS